MSSCASCYACYAVYSLSEFVCVIFDFFMSHVPHVLLRLQKMTITMTMMVMEDDGDAEDGEDEDGDNDEDDDDDDGCCPRCVLLFLCVVHVCFLYLYLLCLKCIDDVHSITCT